MAKIYGAQRKLGYHDIVYNLKSGKFFVPLPGDNYYELDVQTGGGSDFTACTNGGLEYDGAQDCWKIDEAWLLQWANDNRPDMVEPGDGTITIKDSDGASVGSFTVNQEGNTDISLPEVIIPESLHPKGFINVDDPAPANPEHGDIYIQHKIDLSDGVADASFDPGIPTGTVVEEGTFVIFGVDDLWHAGGNANSTQVQADWTETDSTEPSFIKNKGVYMPLDLRTLPALP